MTARPGLQLIVDAWRADIAATSNESPLRSRKRSALSLHTPRKRRLVLQPIQPNVPFDTGTGDRILRSSNSQGAPKPLTNLSEQRIDDAVSGNDKNHPDGTIESTEIPNSQRWAGMYEEGGAGEADKDTPSTLQIKQYTAALSSLLDTRLESPTGSQSSLPTSKRRKRTASPTKRMADLAFTDAPVSYIALRDVKSQLPQFVQQLYEDLDDISQSIEVVPNEIKNEVKRISPNDRLPSHSFTQIDPINEAKLNELVFELHQVLEITENSKLCTEDHDSEAAWNDEVHSRVLKIALKSKNEVGYKNITNARLGPTDLVPKHLNGDVVQSKMVDYAIYLKPKSTLEDFIYQKLKILAQDYQSINQTRYDPLRRLPIVISIETKTADASEQDAHVQLGVWVSAQFARLRRLTTTNKDTLSHAAEMSPLPLIYVSGDVWHVLFAVCGDHGSVTIFGKLMIGSTETVLGVYKILAALRRLAHWISNTYAAWLEKWLMK